MLCCVRYFCPCLRLGGSLVKRMPRRKSLHFTNKINTSCNIRFPKSLGFIELMEETNRCTVQRHWYTDSALQRHWYRQRAAEALVQTARYRGTGTDSALLL